MKRSEVLGAEVLDEESDPRALGPRAARSQVNLPWPWRIRAPARCAGDVGKLDAPVGSSAAGRAQLYLNLPVALCARYGV